MQASELKDNLVKLMLDTGQGHKPVIFLDTEGITWSVKGVVFDHENNVFILSGEETEL